MIARGLLVVLLLLNLSVFAAEIVFVNGGVYTVDDQRSWADSVAVEGGRIVYVGDRTGVDPHISDDTEVIDLTGRMLLPGFHDSHMHAMVAGTRFLRCDFEGLKWPDEVLAKVRECASERETGEWVRGIGLTSAAFDAPVLTRLDAASPEHPVYLDAADFSWVMVNSLALERAGINASTPDPEKGVITRDGTGAPTGILRGTAIEGIYRLLPTPDTAGLRKALRLASELANSFGITSANEAKLRPGIWEAFVAADEAGEMTLRVHGSHDSLAGIDIEQWKRRSKRPGKRFQAQSVKLTLDGGGVGTGAVLEPYAGAEDDFGTFYYPPSELVHLITDIDAAGLDIHLHVVGDRAVRAGLDALEAAIQTNPEWDRRHQLAHLALVHPDDLPRFKELGIVADIQPLWAYLSKQRQLEVEMLRPEPAARMLAFADLFASGARVVAGSDWISESMNPLYSIQIALTRRAPDGSDEAWLPEQRVTLAQMLDAYTRNGAWLARQEDETGTIEVGKAADLIVLERNLFETKPMEIGRVRALLTLLGGAPVFRADDLRRPD